MWTKIKFVKRICVNNSHCDCYTLGTTNITVSRQYGSVLKNIHEACDNSEPVLTISFSSKFKIPQEHFDEVFKYFNFDISKPYFCYERSNSMNRNIIITYYEQVIDHI